MSKFATCVVISALLLTACGASNTRPPPAAAMVGAGTTKPAAVPAADDNLNAVLWTQTATEHDLLNRQAYRAAAFQLDRALADPDWEALAAGERKTPVVDPSRTAVILDIDETTLDNSPYQARLVRDSASYDEFSWAQWCHEEKARAIPGALEFTRLARSKGVTVFYLSNRASDLGDATLANLRKLGFPVEAGEQVFLGLGTIVSGCEQNGSAKGCRRELVSRKYRVLMQVGDQLGDFVDIPANTPAGREQVVAPYLDWVGERWFVLPNPTYGSWEPALFNNDWSLPAGERRRAKRAWLRTE